MTSQGFEKLQEELKKLVIIEKDRQLNQYSVMYFNRIKNG